METIAIVSCGFPVPLGGTQEAQGIQNRVLMKLVWSGSGQGWAGLCLEKSIENSPLAYITPRPSFQLPRAEGLQAGELWFLAEDGTLWHQK